MAAKAPNARFRKMAALPRVDKKSVFSRCVLALKGADEPPLREAATTLCAMQEGQNVRKKDKSDRTKKGNLLKII